MIKNAFPNYYKKAKENSRYYEENLKRNHHNNQASFNLKGSNHSSSFNYILPDPESYNLSNYKSIKRKKSSSSLDLQKLNFKNTLPKNQTEPIKLVDLRPNPKMEYIKQNYIKANGYNQYSQFSPNKSFYRNKEDSKRFTNYLVHNSLKPTYKQDFAREQQREATKLIEKKYQFIKQESPKYTHVKSIPFN